MAIPAIAERLETPAVSSAAAPPARLMSPLGYGVLATIMLITAVVVYFVTRSFQDPAPAPAAREIYEQLDLGPFTRDLQGDSSGLVRDTFMVRVVLVLNPACRDLAAVRSQLERRRDLLKDVVLTQVVHRKSEAELRHPGILETLRSGLRRRLNAEAGLTSDGQEPIQKVIFPDSRLPGPR